MNFGVLSSTQLGCVVEFCIMVIKEIDGEEPRSKHKIKSIKHQHEMRATLHLLNILFLSLQIMVLINLPDSGVTV